MNTVEGKIVLVTGVSSGLGKELAEALLEKGAIVAGTCRNWKDAEKFQEIASESGMGLVMDITDGDAVTTGVSKIIDSFGRIDILVNNAGSGFLGAVEETSDEEARRILDINFFGGLSVIRAVLPHMRDQRSGHIMLCSALGGFHGVPGFGLYAAAKSATIVLGESLAAELSSFGIHVTALTIGVFDTGMSTRVAFAKKEIEDYADTPSAQFKTFIRSVPGKEPNDPTKGAQAMIQLMESATPPVNAALGADALEGMREKLADLETELAEWEDNAVSTLKD